MARGLNHRSLLVYRVVVALFTLRPRHIAFTSRVSEHVFSFSLLVQPQTTSITTITIPPTIPFVLQKCHPPPSKHNRSKRRPAKVSLSVPFSQPDTLSKTASSPQIRIKRGLKSMLLRARQGGLGVVCAITGCRYVTHHMWNVDGFACHYCQCWR